MNPVCRVIPFLQAVGSATPSPRATEQKPVRAWTTKASTIRPEWAFYRKYTEAILRRFMRCSLQSGRVPSMLGKEMFRGKVTSYRMESFDDLLIFVHDVDKCIRRLEPLQQILLTRIAIQEYTPEETAEMLHAKRTTIMRRYDESLDLLTGVFLHVGLLKTVDACQEEEIRKTPASVSLQAAYLAA